MLLCQLQSLILWLLQQQALKHTGTESVALDTWGMSAGLSIGSSPSHRCLDTVGHRQPCEHHQWDCKVLSAPSGEQGRPDALERAGPQSGSTSDCVPQGPLSWETAPSSSSIRGQRGSHHLSHLEEAPAPGRSDFDAAMRHESCNTLPFRALLRTKAARAGRGPVTSAPSREPAACM